MENKLCFKFKQFQFDFSKIKDLFRHISHAISGKEEDYTKIKISKAILYLSIPMVLEMLMESLFAVVDIFFVSKLGADAIATVGITESLMTIIYAIAFGLTAGTSAIISRRTGEKNLEGAKSGAVQAIFMGIIISLILAIPFVIFTKEILGFMGANDVIVHQYSSFTRLLLGSNVVVMLLFVINSIFRSAGNPAYSMRVLWIGNIINMVLDPILIFGLGFIPALGLMGAAIATTTGRSIAVIYQIYILFHSSSKFRLMLKDLKIELGLMLKILKLSVGGIFQSIIATSSWVIMVRLISQFGSEIVAGYTIAIRIVVFALLPSWGLSNAAATLVGQNLGANRPDRAERSVQITSLVNIVFLGVIGAILIVFPQMFIRFFISTPSVLAHGALCLRMISLGFIFYGLGMVMMQAINGAGDTKTPTWINFFCFWIFEIPLAIFLTNILEMNEFGVYLAIPIAETALALIAFWVFKKGKWKLKKV